MNSNTYTVLTVQSFDRQAKRLVKKYPSLKAELIALVERLSADPKLGTDIGKNCFKVRLAIASKGKGKSGGARVITHLHIHANHIYLLSIYDKADQGSISDRDIVKLLEQITP
ncbi:MAG TPA: type II toxin-antitoxin system RelE/ParE family toxin [Sphingobacteriaceae bacterium]|jgi:hypothetical protein|nr:type II toxin-antitoxin system RelE/ParE family toxin [Sphingobacteriaceae bacterium]